MKAASVARAVLLLVLVCDPAFVQVSSAFAIGADGRQNASPLLPLLSGEGDDVVSGLMQRLDSAFQQHHNVTALEFVEQGHKESKRLQEVAPYLLALNGTRLWDDLSNERDLSPFAWLTRALPPSLARSLSPPNTTSPDQLSPLDRWIYGYPDDLRDFVWGVVSDLASDSARTELERAADVLEHGSTAPALAPSQFPSVLAVDAALASFLNNLADVQTLQDLRDVVDTLVESLQSLRLDAYKLVKELQSYPANSTLGRVAFVCAQLPAARAAAKSGRLAARVQPVVQLLEMMVSSVGGQDGDNDNANDNGVEGNVAFLEGSGMPNPVVETLQVLLGNWMLMLAVASMLAVVVLQVVTNHVTGDRKYELSASPVTTQGWIVQSLLYAGYLFSMFSAFKFLAQARHESGMDNERSRVYMRSSLDVLMDMIETANTRRSSKLLDEAHARARDMEEDTDPGEDAGEDTTKLDYQRERFNELFEGKIDQRGRVKTFHVLKFLTDNGVSESAARAYVEQADPNKTRFITFDSFREHVLDTRRAGLTELLSKKSVSLGMATAFVVTAVGILALDGGYAAQLAIMTTVFVVTCGITWAQMIGSKGKIDKAASLNRDVQVFRILLKVLCGSALVVVYFLSVWFFARTCKSPPPHCPNVGVADVGGSQAMAHAVAPNCSLSRSYLEGRGNCKATALECVSGEVKWRDHFSDGPREQYDAKVESLMRANAKGGDNAGFNLVLNRLEVSGIPANGICTTDKRDLSTLPSCIIQAPSGSLATVEDAGDNAMIAVKDTNVKAFAQKDVYFVEWGKPCVNDPASVETVSPRSVLDTDPEFFLNHRNTDNATMITVHTPAVEPGSNFFQMCERSTTTPSGDFAAVAECAYLFAPQMVCGEDDCSTADYGMSGEVVDVLYYSVITHTTIGFGDISPSSLRAKMTMVLDSLLISCIGLL